MNNVKCENCESSVMQKVTHLGINALCCKKRHNYMGEHPLCSDERQRQVLGGICGPEGKYYIPKTQLPEVISKHLDVMQIPDIKAALVETAKSILELSNQCTIPTIPGDDIKVVYEDYKKFKTLPKQINDTRLDGMRPLNEIAKNYKKYVDDVFIAPLVKSLDAHLKAIQEHEKDERERKLKEQQEEQRKQLEAMRKTPAKPMAHAPIPAAPLPPKQEVVIEKRKLPWTYEVTDFAKVPDEYKMTVINEEKVKMAIKAGIRQVKGLRIYQPEVIK